MSRQFKHAIFKIILCHHVMLQIWWLFTSVVWCQIWYHFDHVTSMSWHVVYWCHITGQNVLSLVTKCHITPIPCHAVLICNMAVHHTNSFEDYELRLPTTFKGSFPSHPPLSLSLLPLPPPTVRVRQREGWRGTGKRESLVRRLLLSFLVCLCG